MKIQRDKPFTKLILPYSRDLNPNETESPIKPSIKTDFSNIQAVQTRLNLTNEAAMPLPEPISATVGILANIGAGWLITLIGAQIIKSFSSDVIKPLAEYYSEELYIHFDSKRDIAINRIKNADLSKENIPNMVSKTELMLKQLLIASANDENARKNLEEQIEEVTAILEALYDLKHISTKDKVIRDSGLRGWQSNDYILRGSEAIVSGLTFQFTNAKNAVLGGIGLSSRADWIQYESASDCIAAILEEKHTGRFGFLSKNTQRSLERILALNWNTPLEASTDKKKYEGSMIPSYKRSISFREGIYDAILDSLDKEKDDPLRLKSQIENVEQEKRIKVQDYRDALLRAFDIEMSLEGATSSIPDSKHGEGKFSLSVCNKIKMILEKSAIPSELWSAQAKEASARQEQRKRDCEAFCSWGIELFPSDFKNTENILREAFTDGNLTNEQIKNIDRLRTILKNHYGSEREIELDFIYLLDFMKLEFPTGTNKLTQKNYGKGTLFLSAISKFLFTQVTVGKNQKLRINCLSNDMKTVLRDNILRPIIQDHKDFSSTTRDSNFFLSPKLNSIPGIATQIYQRMEPSSIALEDKINQMVVGSITENLYRDSYKPKAGFLLSGPNFQELNNYINSISNTIAMPIVRLSRNMISEKNGDFHVEMRDDFRDLFSEDSLEKLEIAYGKSLPIGVFFELIDNIHINQQRLYVILHMDEVHEYLKPRTDDEGYLYPATDLEQNLTRSLLSLIEDSKIRSNRKASTLTIFMTSTKIQSSSFDLATIDENGYSPEGWLTLRPFISSAALRPGRIDHKIFSFHRSGIESTQEKPKTDEETAKSTKALKIIIGRLVEIIRSKSFGEEIDYERIAPLIKGMNTKEVEKTIIEKTPNALTTENIIQAFTAKD